MKKSILEHLTNCYESSLKTGNKNYVFGFYKKIPENVEREYLFPKGKFIITLNKEDFLLFKYEPQKEINLLLENLKNAKKLEEIGMEKESLKKLIEYGDKLEKFPDEQKIESNLVTKCMSTVYLYGEKENKKMKYLATSDSAFVRGELYLILSFFKNLKPKEIISKETNKEYINFFSEIKNLVPISMVRSQGFGGIYEKIVEIAIKNL